MAGKNLEFTLNIDAQTNAAQAENDINSLLQLAVSSNKEVAEAAKRTIAQLRGFSGEYRSVLQLQVKTDESGLKNVGIVQKQLLDGFDDIGGKIAQAFKVDPNSLTSLRQQVNTAKQQRDELNRLVTTTNIFGQTVAGINPKWDAANQKVKQLTQELNRAGASNFWDRIKADLGFDGVLRAAGGLSDLVNTFQSIAIVVGQVTASVNALINSFRELQAFQTSFEAVGEGAVAGTIAFKEATSIASRLGTDLRATRDGFKQLTPVILATGGTAKDVSTVVEALSSRFLAFGRSADESRRIMNGIIQAFAKGKLQSEELTQQIAEADPAFKSDLAAAIGVSTQALEELVEAGQITGQVLLEALPKLGKASEGSKKLGQSATDAANALGQEGVIIDQVLNKLKTIETVSFENLGRAFEPFLVSILKARAAVIDFFSNLADSSVVRDLGQSLAGITTVISGVISNLLKVGQSILTLIQPVLKLINAFGQIPGALSLISTAITAAILQPFFKIFASFDGLKLAIGQIVASFNTAKGAFAGAGTAVNALATQLNALNTTSSQTGQLSTATAQALQANIAALNGSATASTTATQATTNQATAQQGLNAALNAGKTATAGQAQSNTAIAASTQGITTATTAASTAIRGQTVATTQQVAATGALKTALTGVAPAANAAVQSATALTATLALVGTSSVTAAQKLQLLKSINFGALNPQQFAAIANGINQIGLSAQNAAPKVGVLQAALGRIAQTKVGQSLGSMGTGLRGLTGGITAAAAGFIKFEIVIRTIGAVISVIDAAEAKTASLKSAQDSNASAAKKLEAAFRAFNGEIGNTDEVTDEASSEFAEVEERLNAVTAAAIKTTGPLAEAFNTSLPAIGRFAGTIKGLNDFIENSLPGAMSNAEAALAEYDSTLGETGGRNLEVAEAVNKTIGSLRQQVSFYTQAAEAAAEKAAEDGKITKAEQAAIDASKRRIKVLTEAIEKLRGNAMAVGLDIDSFEEAGNALDFLKQKIQETLRSIEELGQAEIDSIKVAADDEINKLEGQKRELEDAKEALSESSSSSDSSSDSGSGTEAIEAAKAAEKEQSDQRIANLENIKATVEANSQAELEQIDRAAQASQAVYDRRIADIEAAAAVSQAAYDEEIAAIDAAASASQARYDKEVEAINRKYDAEQQRINEANTTGPGTATAQLKALEITKERKRLEEQIRNLQGPGNLEGRKEAELRLQAFEEELRSKEQLAENEKRRQEELAKAKEEADKRAVANEAARQSAILAFEAERAEQEKQRQEAEKQHETQQAALEQARQQAEADAKAAIQQLEQAIAQEKAESEAKQKEFEKEIEGIKDASRKADADARKKKETEEKAINKAIQQIEDQIRTVRETSAKKVRDIEEEIKKKKAEAKRITDQAGENAEGSLKRQIGLFDTLIDKAKELRLLQLGKNKALGGPVAGGSTYTVNEAGREAFLSASGRLSMINAPAWGSWTAPSSGLVIPASITKGLNIPRGGINVNRAPRINATRVTRSGPSMMDVLRIAGVNNKQSALTPDQVHNISATQAQQAIAIGKLSRAVRDLHNKDWNVNVRVQNGGSSNSYLHTLNTLR